MTIIRHFKRNPTCSKQKDKQKYDVITFDTSGIKFDVAWTS